MNQGAPDPTFKEPDGFGKGRSATVRAFVSREEAETRELVYLDKVTCAAAFRFQDAVRNEEPDRCLVRVHHPGDFAYRVVLLHGPQDLLLAMVLFFCSSKWFRTDIHSAHFLEVLLVIFFGCVERTRTGDLGYDRSSIPSRVLKLPDGIPHLPLLIRIVIKDSRPVLFADVRTLPVHCCRIVD